MHVNLKNDWLQNPILNLKTPFKDERGVIQNLVSLKKSQIRSAVIIEAK